MWQQILAIVWAQFRVTRNHLPRTGFGGILMALFTALWYAMFAGLAVLGAITIPLAPVKDLNQMVPVGLLALFAYTQFIPLLTLSAGWSLQINKLQAFPIRNSALFGLEVLLRITASPEVIVLLVGGMIGLMRHPGLYWANAFWLLLFLPFNLLLQLAMREFVSHAFQRSRFREIITVLLLSVGFLPQLVLRGRFGPRLKPYFLLVAQSPVTPWHQVASLSLGHVSFYGLLLLAGWTELCYLFARRQFNRGLTLDDAFRGGVRAGVAEPKTNSSPGLLGAFSNLFKDPMAALLQKEFQSLLRMPRFRVMLGMACVFSVLVFLPLAIEGGPLARNYFPLVNLYALLMLGDALLLNVLGFDRGAVQLYFVTPIPLAAVIKAKNVAACTFILLQNLIVAVVMRLFMHTPFIAILAGIVASAAATVNLLWAGNLLSVTMPRPIDPSSTFRKQANAKAQLWILLCTIGMAVLVGFAYLARWAFDNDLALLGALLFEFAIGLVVYKVAMESVVERGMRNREQIVDTLSKGASPVSGSLGLS